MTIVDRLLKALEGRAYRACPHCPAGVMVSQVATFNGVLTVESTCTTCHREDSEHAKPRRAA
jgi:uncharacterized protein (DUF983 family)